MRMMFILDNYRRGLLSALRAGSTLLAFSAIGCLLGAEAHAATYYWDTNGDTAGFGAAGGTWGTSDFWSTSSAGTAVTANSTTNSTNATTDALHFGTAADGLASGTITVDATRNAGSLTFGGASGAITLSGGNIALPTGGQGQLTTPNFIVNNAAGVVVSSAITSASNVNKSGSGTLTLTGTNNYARTIIQQGIIEVPTISNASIPSTLGGSSNNPVNLQIFAGSGTDGAGLVYTGLSAGVTNRGVGLVGNAANLTAVIGVVSNSSLTITGQLTDLNQAYGSGGGTALGSGNAGLEVNRYSTTAGTLILTNNGNNYDGATLVNKGSLHLGDGGASGRLSTNSAIDLVTSNANLTINRSNTVSQGVDFTSAAITGSGSFTQAGAGTTTLTANNAYTGTTTIDAGRLNINGSHLNGALFTVNASGVLGGSGNTGAPVLILDDGVLSPGVSAGQLATGDLSLSSLAALDWELDAPNQGLSAASDRVDVTGDLALAGILNVAGLANFGTPTSGDSWLLFTYSGALTDNGVTFGTLPALGTGLSYVLDTSVNNQVSLRVVPEPATGMLFVITSGLVTAFARRKRRGG